MCFCSTHQAVRVGHQHTCCCDCRTQAAAATAAFSPAASKQVDAVPELPTSGNPRLVASVSNSATGNDNGDDRSSVASLHVGDAASTINRRLQYSPRSPCDPPSASSHALARRVAAVLGPPSSTAGAPLSAHGSPRTRMRVEPRTALRALGPGSYRGTSTEARGSNRSARSPARQFSRTVSFGGSRSTTRVEEGGGGRGGVSVHGDNFGGGSSMSVVSVRSTSSDEDGSGGGPTDSPSRRELRRTRSAVLHRSQGERKSARQLRDQLRRTRAAWSRR